MKKGHGCYLIKKAEFNRCAAAINSVGRNSYRANAGFSERTARSFYPLSAQARFALAAEVGFLAPFPFGPSE